MSWTCLLRSRLIPGSASLRRFYSYSYEASRQRYTLAEESSGERPRPLYFKVPSKGKPTQQKQPLASKPNRPLSTSFIAASHPEPPRPAARPKAALKNRDGGYAIHAQNMSSHVQIVATPTADTAGAGLLLHFDHRRYHFGTLAQGTQRAISQRGHSLAKLNKIFIAGEVNWETTGGMLGMMLTVADGLAAVAQDVKNSNEARRKEGKREIATPNKTFEIFGGKNTAHTVATARNFIFRTGMPIKAVDLTLDPRAAGGSPTRHDYSTPDWEDDTILVWHVPVVRSRPAAAAAAAAAAGNDTRLGSQSPRARSRSASPPRKRQQIADNTVHDIVENMFNSDWSKDGLFETKLADVQMPAKIFIRENGNIKKYNGPTPSTRDAVVPDLTVLVRKPWPSAMVTDLPPTTMSDTSLCYVVKNRGRRGKLNPKVAIELGVAKPDFKRLTAGETVKAMDGKDVTPDMVLEAPMKGQGFAVLAIPSLEHVSGFLERPEWQSDELLDNVQIFYWIFGRGVFDDPSIQEFIKSKPHIRHLVMGADISPNMITYESYAALFTKLHRLDPARFPVLQFDNTFRDIPKVDGLTVEIGRTGMKAHMLPNFKINDAEIVPFPLLNEAEQIDEQVIALAEEARQKVAEPSFTDLVEQDEKDIPNRDALIVPLGTGSAAPSKYRNVSSTLIRVPGVGSYLLDAGENTIGYTDLCAALCAVGIRADELQVWKEVDGIFTADPSKVPTARLLPSITPSEAAELTFYGSEVIHHLTMDQVIHANPPIPIRIKNVKNPTGVGTIVVPDPVLAAGHRIQRHAWSDPARLKKPKRPTAVTIKDKISVINVHSNKRSISHGFFAKVFSILDRHQVSVDLISTSEVHVSMAIHVGNSEPGQFDKARLELEDCGDVSILHDMAILSLVGAEMKNMVGIAGRMFSTLGEHQVNLEMISQGASEINISCVIGARDATRAMNILHTNLFTFLD
ncbi:Aspartate kinase FUB3 like protein [Verticillium longisporum]|nr:Aspartate kinase FUB3 like protein [Verticillium longisporum]